MANDGLLFKVLAKINPRTKTPVMATLLSGFLAGLCYAEFGARVPRAGSAYVYSYVCVGEFIAFVIGWNLIMEYAIANPSLVHSSKESIPFMNLELESSVTSPRIIPRDSIHVRKVFNEVSLAESQLARHLSVIDLTALSVGSTLGVGLYVLAGSVSKTTAGLCYAEFGARVPRAGSAYVYSYVCVGEFIAFVIGWNLIMEYAIGAASVARGLSAYLDDLCNDEIKHSFNESMHMGDEVLGMQLAEYPDFLACGMTLVFVDIKKDRGEGGFLPFGVIGVIQGAATCFYGFVGFDCVATAGEETKNPQRTIPIAVVASLTIIFLAYFGIATVLNLMVPYYSLHETAPLPEAFKYVGWEVIGQIVSIGAIFGLLTSLFGALFPLPRIIYAMSSDGIIFRFLGKINSRFQTPIIGTFVSGILTAAMTLVFDLAQLIEMMSIGTLMAYSIVAACVLLLRYQKIEGVDEDPEEITPVGKSIFMQILYQIFNIKNSKTPSILSGKMVPFVPVIPGISILVNIYLMMMLNIDTWKRFGYWMLIGFIIYFGYGIWQSDIVQKKAMGLTRTNSNNGKDINKSENSKE
ncbi:hypothetical protein C0J52_06402 [Blattella germanica]|nr:hypothetical protein C0J52_06402 [Blattella germanica]